MCLDAETLAAWVDGGLDARAAAMAEAHVSSCPRCQEIAGMIVKTTPVLVAEKKSWFRAAWLVPVTAGIAAVGLWMAVPASDRYAAPPAPPVARPAPEQSKAKIADELKQVEPSAAAPKTASPAEESRAKEQAGARARDARAKNEALPKDADKKRFDEAKADTLADANKLPAQPAPVFAPPPPSPSAPARPQTPPAAASAAPAGAAAAESGRLEKQATRQAFSQVVTREAASPDGTVRWRITSANTLERSGDQGRTWVLVDTGAGAALTSIQAADANIATVTTVDGRQFRTIDSGKTWRVFP